MNNIEKYRTFIDSLDGEKGLRDEIHRLLVPGKDTWQLNDEFWSHTHGAWFFIAPERVGLIVGSGYYGNADNIDKDVIGRRAESRQIPDLKEKVIELVRDLIEIGDQWVTRGNEWEQFRALCAEVKP